jgi:hypothetical protein
VPSPTDFRRFRLRGKDYYHIENGWTLHCIDTADRSRQHWRVYWGRLRVGADYPYYVTAYEADGYVDFPEFEDAVRWITDRRGTI